MIECQTGRITYNIRARYRVKTKALSEITTRIVDYDHSFVYAVTIQNLGMGTLVMKIAAFRDFMGKFQWVNSYGKKQCRSIFWRMRAALRRRSKQQLEFRYDPSSYALNFDDGCCHSSVGTDKVEMDRFPGCLACKNTIWVYVLWVK
ncbi:hypothetical protein V6N13_023368 [Hibiscus sabdariffa]